LAQKFGDRFTPSRKDTNGGKEELNRLPALALPLIRCRAWKLGTKSS
jgi:hypothetical protein